MSEIVANVHREVSETLREQHFTSYQQWVNKARSWLTSHEHYHPEHFKARCFDSRGRLCLMGGDFMRAEREGTFPVYWLWPDQIAWLGASLAGEGIEIAWPPEASTALRILSTPAARAAE